MATVAEQLRLAREEQNLTVAHLAEISKIKADHLRALEEGNYDRFAAPVYVRGFVRTYASLLKLDVPRIMSDVDLELSLTEKFKDGPQFKGLHRGPLDFVMLQLSKINWNIAVPVLAVAVAVVIGIFGFRAWRTHQTTDPLSELGSGLYQPAKPSAGEVLPLPTNAPARK